MKEKDMFFISHAQSRMTWEQSKINAEFRILSELPAKLGKNYDLTQGSVRATSSSITEKAMMKHKLLETGYLLEV